MRSKVSYVILLLFITGFVLLFLFHIDLYDVISREDHVIENLSSVFLFGSSILLFFSFLRSRNLSRHGRLLPILLLGISIVFFLVAGEEISWGQRIFGIATPDSLKAINDQDELNFHNINKKFFDRLLDRLTIIFVIVSTVLFILHKKVIIGIKCPDIFVICAFALIAFYQQTNSLDFYHILYLALGALLAFGVIYKKREVVFTVVITLFFILFIAYVHDANAQLFPSHNNSANEYREFLFSFCCLSYAYVIMQNMPMTLVEGNSKVGDS